MRGLASVPEAVRTAVRNNGGGHSNHALFWTVIGPKCGGEPTGPLGEAINTTFGSVEIDGARRIIGEEHIADSCLKYWIAVCRAGVGAHVSNLTRSGTG